jgi:hypothetical protein
VRQARENRLVYVILAEDRLVLPEGRIHLADTVQMKLDKLDALLVGSASCTFDPLRDVPTRSSPDGSN